jgi:hypothetical protein
MIVDKPFIDMLVIIMNKKKNFTKVELDFYAKILKIPKGCCFCEGEKGGFFIDYIGNSPLEKVFFMKWAKLQLQNPNINSFDEDIQNLCSGNYIKVKK